MPIELPASVEELRALSSLTPRGIVAELDRYVVGQAAAKALLDNTELGARDIVKKSLEIAGEICIYTNQNHTLEVLE